MEEENTKNVSFYCPCHGVWVEDKCNSCVFFLQIDKNIDSQIDPWAYDITDPLFWCGGF